jgi:hypothetical protein
MLEYYLSSNGQQADDYAAAQASLCPLLVIAH